MAQEKATEQFRVYPSTHKRLKIRAVREEKTIADLIEELSKLKDERMPEDVA